MAFVSTLQASLHVYLKSKEVRLLLGVCLVTVLLVNLLYAQQNHSEKAESLAYTNLQALLTFHHVVVLLVAYVFQMLEGRNKGLKRFASLPTSFYQVFSQRLMAVALVSGLYWLVSFMSNALLSDAHRFTYLSGYYMYLLLPLSSYLVLVSLSSMFTNNLGMGVAQLLLFLFLSFQDLGSLIPFGYALDSMNRVSINLSFQESSVFWGEDMYWFAKLNLLVTAFLLTVVYFIDKQVNLLYFMVKKG
ncbi:hypothetical protein GU926_03185 [Nibribacter ruber]|uniref:Uncharacterized protein n=1 Tax=Nibribacter ruber TaxID=2698458 RepID=A0A6P1NS49_9BACT|nr:hypothetical protein [Nibribacter ruber]QHL86497.1 hypothetical protein GU926_03185 [Nibribacter ruber]